MAKQPRSLHGKVIAITGGARGIGRATAAALVREGAVVAIGDVDADEAKATAGELGERVHGYALDVTDRQSFEQFLDQVERDHGPLDVLINNAGIMSLSPTLDAEDDTTAARMVDINLHGVLLGCKLAAPRMRARRSGHLVNIASMAGKAGFPGGATYSATKHAVIGLSEALRGELHDDGVDVSVVMPVIVNTSLASGLKSTRLLPKQDPEDVAAAIVAALKRPRFDVYVPREAGWIHHALQLVPRQAREALSVLFKFDRALVDIDAGARSAYEARAARSEPKLAPEEAKAQDEQVRAAAR